MVEVSEKFKQLAQENGRRVWCKIYAGGEVFYDDKITDFTFDDIAHPDWYTIGTTCANRFHFSARSEAVLSAGDTVLPYISFDGEEWCPLGVFFISRRYVRDNYISITAYDKLYSLGEEYRWEGALPTNSAEVLKDICEKCSLECEDYGYPYTIEAFSEVCSVRDMIGYIAGLNNACAKIDRLGRLVMRKFNRVDFYLQDKNCMDIRRNMTDSVITCLKSKSAEGELTAGSGAEISTLEMYNPLMTQHILNTLYSMYKPFSFYGADIEMQGMPFLEAGECVQLLHGKMLYNLVISEVEYTYDGGLTAMLYSKNRCYTDAVVHEDDLEVKLDDLNTKLSAMYVKYINESLINISGNSTVLVDFAFESQAEGFAQVDISFSISAGDADIMDMKIFVNGKDSGRVIRHTLRTDCVEQLHVFHLAELPKGNNTILFSAQVKNGSAYIPPHGLLAGAVIHGAGAGGVRDKISLIDTFKLSVTDEQYVFAGITESISSEWR